MACVLETKNDRVSWQSPELQELFLRVVNQLGIDKATPKKITELMDVPGLEKKHVASHLQRFRLGLKSSKTKSKSGRENSKQDQYHLPDESLEVVESMPEQDQYHVPNESPEVVESMPEQDQYHVPNLGMEQQVSRNINDKFEETDFVYPRGDPDAVCLSKRDVDLLKPNTYINDTIIDFYILFLKNKMQEQDKARVHFFNSFFFPKLAGMDKNAPYACDGKSAFQSVRKWTRKVNLFEKDYIFIPVNFNYHWSLIVICYPGEVVNINDTEPEKSLRLPCILHMDSIKGYHSGLKGLVESYLCEEWKERKKDTCGVDLSSRFLNMCFLPVDVPQQENKYDCGLFLLHHLELFLAESPFNFNPFRITKSSNFLNSDWFPPAEAYLKRTFIRRLIFELVENHGSREGFSPENGDDCLCSEYNDNRIGGQCHLINGEASGQGIELAQHLNTSSMVLKEHLKPGATFGTSLRDCQSFDNMIGGQFHLINRDTSGRGIELAQPLNTSSSMVLKEHLEPGATLGSSLRHCQSFDQRSSNHCFNGSYPMSIENIRHLLDNYAATINFPFNKSRSSLEDGHRENHRRQIENLEHFLDMDDHAPVSNLAVDPLIYFSQDWNMMCAGNKIWSPTLQLHQVSNAVDNEVFYDDVQIIDNMKLDFWEEQPAKKRRLMHFPGESDGIHTSFTLI